jgi:hypothetical protein
MALNFMLDDLNGQITQEGITGAARLTFSKHLTLNP